MLNNSSIAGLASSLTSKALAYAVIGSSLLILSKAAFAEYPYTPDIDHGIIDINKPEDLSWSLNFGDVEKGIWSTLSPPCIPFKVLNTVGRTVEITPSQSGGAFSFSNHCGDSLKQGDHCEIDVCFRPSVDIMSDELELKVGDETISFNVYGNGCEKSPLSPYYCPNQRYAVEHAAWDPCATLPGHPIQPTPPSLTQMPALSDSVKKEPSTEKYCNPYNGIGEGGICEMTLKDAAAYCASQGHRLPTARELGLFASTRGARGVADLKQYCQNPDHSDDFEYKIYIVQEGATQDMFPYAANGYRKPGSEPSSTSLWSSSQTAGSTEYVALDTSTGVLFSTWGEYTQEVRCVISH